VQILSYYLKASVDNYEQLQLG